MPPFTFCVIDDDASVRKALKRLIRAAGMAVTAFASAEDFLSAQEFLSAGQAAPDCLVVDVRMPGMSGLKLQQRLAAEGRDVPMVFITAHEDEVARRIALAAGAAGFLYKPFDDQQLLGALDRAIAERTARAKHPADSLRTRCIEMSSTKQA